MSQNLQFEITVDVNYGRFKMQVERIHAGDSLEKFRVSAGGRSVVLQSNRPELLHTGSRKAIDWKLREGQFNTTNVQEATFALFKVMTSIEDYVKQREPTLKEYNQQRSLFA
jgi:hypothetical protein